MQEIEIQSTSHSRLLNTMLYLAFHAVHTYLGFHEKLSEGLKGLSAFRGLHTQIDKN